MRRHVTISARLVRSQEPCRDHGGTTCRICPNCVASLVTLLHGLSDDPPALRHACCDILRTIGGLSELAGYATVEDAARERFVHRIVAPMPEPPRDPSTATDAEPYLIPSEPPRGSWLSRLLWRRSR